MRKGKKTVAVTFFFARLQFEFWLGFMWKSTFLMEAHDKRAQRGSVSQRAVGLSSHSRTPRRVEALGGGGHGRLLPKARARPRTAASAVRWVMHVGPMSRAHSQAHESQVPNPVFWAHCTRLWNPLQTFNPSRCHLLESGDSRVSLSRPFCRPVLYPYEPQSNS